MRSLPCVNEHFEGERNAEITLLDTFGLFATFFYLTLHHIKGEIYRLLKGAGTLLGDNIVAGNMECNKGEFVALLVVLVQLQNYIYACRI